VTGIVLGERSLASVPAPLRWTDRLARRAVLAVLSRLARGEVVLEEGGRRIRFGAATAELPEPASLTVSDPRFYRAIALGGSIGAGEAFLEGWWTSDDPARLLRIVASNPEIASGVEAGIARLHAPLEKVRHVLRRNTRSGSRKNIESHYDLGNEFFSLFLDPTMTYSAAVFPSPDATLEEASLHKLDRICRDLRLATGDRVVEIGGGWGGFAIHAAREYGCRVTTATVSRAQRDFALRRVREAGLSDRVTVVLEDYRDLPRALGERFDKGVSVEMIEAVGHGFLPAYFGAWRDLLSPGGTLFLQAIIIGDEAYDRYRRSVDFIQKHVFPGGCLPSLAAIRRAAEGADLSLRSVTDITPHYAETLRRWRRRFLLNVPKARALGLSERFLRLWEYYLCYCEAGFEARNIFSVQTLLDRAGVAR